VNEADNIAPFLSKAFANLTPASRCHILRVVSSFPARHFPQDRIHS